MPHTLPRKTESENQLQKFQFPRLKRKQSTYRNSVLKMTIGNLQTITSPTNSRPANLLTFRHLIPMRQALQFQNQKASLKKKYPTISRTLRRRQKLHLPHTLKIITPVQLTGPFALQWVPGIHIQSPKRKIQRSWNLPKRPMKNSWIT